MILNPRHNRAAQRAMQMLCVCAAALFVSSSALAAGSTTDQPSESSGQVKTLLILPFDMVDTSLQGELNEGPLKSDVERLDRTEQIVRRAMDHLADFDVVQNETVEKRIHAAQDTYRYLYSCNGCDVDIGRAADADLVMTGWVQKVSNLILNINATIRRVDTGQEVSGASVDMRNDTDDSWRSSGLYLVEHPLLSQYRSNEQAIESGDASAKDIPEPVPINRYPG